MDSVESAEIKVGDIAYVKVFDSSGLKGWAVKPSGAAKLVRDSEIKRKVLQVNAGGKGESGAIGEMDVLGKVSKSTGSTFLVSTSLGRKLRKYVGCALDVELDVKAEGVPLPAKPWNGVRISANYATVLKNFNHSYNGLSGTFDWKVIKYRIRIPKDIKAMSFDLGLISPAGKVWFDRIRMRVADLPFASQQPESKEVYKGHGLPRLRGFVTGIRDPKTANSEKYFKEISTDWKANVMKLWFHPGGDQDLAACDERLDKWLAGIDKAVEMAKEQKIYLILHVADNWHNSEHGGNSLYFEDPVYADKLVDIWKTIAERYKGEKSIWAFELLNEPSIRLPIARGCLDYPDFMGRIAREINAIDAERAIIVQTEQWWGTQAFGLLRPIKAKNIIYAVHFYSPFKVTHQGISGVKGKKPWDSYCYPGIVKKRKWDKEALRRDLQIVRDFQKAYGVHIIVSEFSCVRWAPGDTRVNLLKDMIDIYEEYGWDWIYHAYPEWHGWSPKLGPEPYNQKIPGQPTATEKLLKEMFAKNQKPLFD